MGHVVCGEAWLQAPHVPSLPSIRVLEDDHDVASFRVRRIAARASSPRLVPTSSDGLVFTSACPSSWRATSRSGVEIGLAHVAAHRVLLDQCQPRIRDNGLRPPSMTDALLVTTVVALGTVSGMKAHIEGADRGRGPDRVAERGRPFDGLLVDLARSRDFLDSAILLGHEIANRLVPWSLLHEEDQILVRGRRPRGGLRLEARDVHARNRRERLRHARPILRVALLLLARRLGSRQHGVCGRGARVAHRRNPRGARAKTRKGHCNLLDY